MKIVPDWQLPAGVSRGVWAYVQSEELAKGYDQSLSGSPLMTVDCQFVHHHCLKPGRLIDLGCGTGRLALYMAQRGHRCLGVDLSPGMLGIAASKARAAGLTIDLLQANLLELQCLDAGRFDYAVCLFSTLGMLSDPLARKLALEQAHRLLRPGGLLILHVHNRWFDIWHPGGLRQVGGDLLCKLLGRPGAGDRAMSAHGDVPAFTLHLFTRSEVIALLKACAFSIRQIDSVSLTADGRLRQPWFLGWLRAYGYLIAACKSE